MSKHSPLRRTAALAMSAALLLGCIPAYAVDNGVTPTYDEAYYATTDYYGNLTEGSVVKSYTTNGIVTLTDYGEYDEIVNLTNDLAPSTVGGRSVFSFEEGDIPAHFYFEGKTAKPFEELPWTLSVHYTLNGVATRAEDLAGERGVVEITVDAMPNEGASEYARNNYTLEAMAIFNQDDILSLEAPGAQVQLVGNLRAVLFIGLPGEECHFTIRIGSDDFSFGGMTFLMVPATLSQLEEIAKLSERKDDLEENYDKLSSSLDVLLDSMNGISSSLYATASGLDELNEARDTISTGKGEVYDKAALVRGDLDALRDSLDALPGHLDSASQLADDTHKSLGKVNDALRDVQESLENVQDEIDELTDELYRIRNAGNVTASDLTALGRRVDSLNTDLSELLGKIDALKIRIGSGEITMQGMTAAEISAKLESAQTLEMLYTSAKNGLLTKEQFFKQMLVLRGSSESTAAATATQLVGLLTSVEEGVQAAMTADPTLTVETALTTVLGTLSSAEQGYYTQAKQLETLYASVQGGMSEENFFLTVLPMTGMNALQAQQSWALFEQSKNLTDSVEGLCGLLGSSGLSGHTAKLLRETGSAITNLTNATDELDDLLDSLDDALDAADEVYDILDKNLPELKQTLTDTKTTVTALSATVADTNDFLAAFESLLKTSGIQLDVGTKDTLAGLAAALRATARSLNTTGDVKSAKNNIGSIIEDTWHEYTGDVNNLLLMDATAETVSLTDTRNAAPQSIQVLIRTQEIKADAAEKAELAAKEVVQTTFWQRVTQMFRDFWSAVTGIFKGKD